MSNMNGELESRHIAADLCKLALLLNTHNLCSDVSPLNNAGQSFIQATTPGWQYTLQKMTFHSVDEVGGRLPSDCADITVSLSVAIKGELTGEDSVSNPLTALNLDIELDGLHINPLTDELDQLYSAWHLDLHIEGPADSTPKFSHPLYHFAFGGHKMELKGDSFFGNTLILPSPRLMYPPMDAVLGVDFILQNYFRRSKIKHIMSDPEYIQIVRKSQVRLWKPFFSSLYTYWGDLDHKVHHDFTYKKLFPFYC